MKDLTTRYIAIILALLIAVLIGWAIYRQVNEYYLQYDPKLEEIRTALTPFFAQPNKKWGGHLEMLNTRDIMNEVGFYKGNKSYTINKEKIFICLRDEKDDSYPMNMLIYVTLHEISHSLCPEIGHTEKFNEIFEDLLLEATRFGVYNPSIPILKNYCGHD